MRWRPHYDMRPGPSSRFNDSGYRMAQKDFLTLWKGANPDIPILKEAKAEYAMLQ